MYPFRYEENNLMNITMLENAEKFVFKAVFVSLYHFAMVFKKA